MKPGIISPKRDVPAHIVCPDYAATGIPVARTREMVRSNDVIARMRTASKIAADVLALTGAAVAPGVTTDELDAIAHDACIARNAYPSTLNYNGYPKSLCTSVNEVICHGIPDDRPLQEGDIVNLDFTAFFDGVHGDTNATYCVGEVDEGSKRLVRVTKDCMERGIAQVRPGAPINAIGKAIQEYAERYNYGVIRTFVGHGVAEQFHCPPTIPHFYDPRATVPIEEGMTFTIEPMISMGSWREKIWPDNWTALTIDGSRVAQFEHTMVVTSDGVEVLTVAT